MDLRKTKIRIFNDEQARKVLKALDKEGISNTSLCSNWLIRAGSFYINDRNSVAHMNRNKTDIDYFHNDNYKEITFKDLNIYLPLYSIY